MKCAVVAIVIFLTINGICLATGNIANQLAISDGPSAKIQSCVGKVIEHILNPSESLAFVITSHPDYIPGRLPNPVTVVDIRVPLPTQYKRYEVNYVIQVESLALFLQTMRIITKSSLWHRMESPKGKFVILIKGEEALQTIFAILWRQTLVLHIIVVIYEDSSKNCPMKVITSNPQAEGNNCARKPTVFSNFSCDNISVEFLKPIRNYNGCPVFILPMRSIQLDMNEKRGRIMYNLLTGLNRILNVTAIFLVVDGKKRLSEAHRGNEIFMFEGDFGKIKTLENSVIFSRTLFLWMGPYPTPISPFKTVFLPFKYDLWIAVLFITILMVLVKWMIIIINGNEYNNNYVNLGCAFTDIIGLTFGVCVNRIPNIWSLKLLLGFFLVYIIHIHTAYTSDLIDILTVPRYEGRIKNVKEVGDAGISIVMFDYLAKAYFENVTDDGSLLGKISKLITPIKDFHSINAAHFIVSDEDDVGVPNSKSKFNGRYLRKRKENKFLSNEVSGEIKKVFLLKNGSYFVESLNAMITHLWESGTYEADANLNPSPYNVTIKESASIFDVLLLDDRIPQPLSLKDLLPIFVILLICYFFCIIIFVAEICLHKIVAQYF